MKRKKYYVLFLLYVIVVAFVLYLNGVFTGEWETSVNLIINVGFLAITGILFGICSISFGRLGHQAICEAFGATISYAKQLMHGKQSVINVDTGCQLFNGLPGRAEVARYHSLTAVKETIPEELLVTAVTDDDEVMAVKHRDYNIFGVQFHPESIMTPDGMKMLKNFLECN